MFRVIQCGAEHTAAYISVTYFSINYCTLQEFCIWMTPAGRRLIKLLLRLKYIKKKLSSNKRGFGFVLFFFAVLVKVFKSRNLLWVMLR